MLHPSIFKGRIFLRVLLERKTRYVNTPCMLQCSTIIHGEYADGSHIGFSAALKPEKIPSTQDVWIQHIKLLTYGLYYNLNTVLTHCGRVTQICVFNTVNLGTSASSPQCHFARGNVSRGITPSNTTRVFGEYFLKISVHRNSQRICYKFVKKHSINVD